MKKTCLSIHILIVVMLMFAVIGICNSANALITAKIRSYPETCKVNETIEIKYSTGGLGSSADDPYMIINIYAVMSKEQLNQRILLHTEKITDKSNGTLSFKVGPEAGKYIGIQEVYFWGEDIEGGTCDKVIHVINGTPLKSFDELNLGQSGWVYKNGKTYYGDENGIAVTQQQEIDGKNYYFDDLGVLCKGWNKDPIDGKWFYANNDGVLIRGHMEGVKNLYIPSYVDALQIEDFYGMENGFYIQCEPQSYAESFAFKYCLPYYNGNNTIGSSISSVEEKVKWIVKNYISNEMSDKEKVKKLLQWLQVNACYDYSFRRYSARDILIDGCGVCQSSALAFCLLMDEVGIENKFFTGICRIKSDDSPSNEHAWTLVRIDGHWYHTNPVCTGMEGKENNKIVFGSYGELLFCRLYTDVDFDKEYYWNRELVEVDNNKIGWVKTKAGSYYYDGRPENGGRVTGKYPIDDEEYFFDETGRLIKDEDAIKEAQISAFVTRCYQIILGREPDAGGLKTWYNELISGRKAASEIIDNFVRSQEFLGKHYSNADAVEILYKAMLGRGSDPAGKADWVGKLDAGYPFAVVINGFCGSKEFKEICDSYGITPGSVSMEQGSASDQQIRAFVTRCYKIILGRDPDEVGMNTWFSELKSRRRTAAEIIEQFVYSQEFQNKKYSNPDAVEILYKAMLGRGSDPAGKADWVGRLAGGQPLTAIINGFCGSKEFTAICDAYGITPGSVQVQSLSHQTEIQEEPVAKQIVTKTENNVTKVEIVNPSDTENEQLGTAVQAIYVNEEKAKEFIGRCYRCILGREASQTELDGWIGQMLNGTKTADQIARGFLFSGEFKDKNVGNEELVKILYRVYLNREADAEGLTTWTQKLDEGTSLQALLDVFSTSNEFKNVVRTMGS